MLIQQHPIPKHPITILAPLLERRDALRLVAVPERRQSLPRQIALPKGFSRLRTDSTDALERMQRA